LRPVFSASRINTFQTCILNLHQGHIMCRSMVDILSTTAENRRGKKKKGKEEKTIAEKNIMVCPIWRPWKWTGGHF